MGNVSSVLGSDQKATEVVGSSRKGIEDKIFYIIIMPLYKRPHFEFCGKLVLLTQKGYSRTVKGSGKDSNSDQYGTCSLWGKPM